METTPDEIARAQLPADRAELAAKRGRWAGCLEDAEIFPAWGSKGSHEVSPEAVSEMLDPETLALTFAEGRWRTWARLS